jgi:outer membrane protein
MIFFGLLHTRTYLTGRGSPMGPPTGSARRSRAAPPVLLLGAVLAQVGSAVEARGQDIQLSLGRAIELAADSAAVVEVARMAEEEAHARLVQARAVFLPSLGGTVGWIKRTLTPSAMGIDVPGIPEKVGPFDVFDARLRFGYTLVDFSGWSRIGGARSATEVTGAEGERAVALASERAALAYLSGVRAMATLAARSSDLQLAEELLGIAERQLQQGVGTALDLSRARTQVVAARRHVEIARNQRAQADVSIARALGLSPEIHFTLRDSLLEGLGTSAADTSLASAVRQALDGRPEMRAATARIGAALAGRRAIVAERFPRIDLMADFGAIGRSTDDLFDTWQVGLQLSVPVFDGLRREGRIAEQDARVRALRVAHADLRWQIQAEVDAALLDFRTGGDLEAIAGQQLELAQTEVDQARRRFAEGLAGNLELINAQASLVRARDAVIAAETTRAAARIRLAQATGTLHTIR